MELIIAKLRVVSPAPIDPNIKGIVLLSVAEELLHLSPTRAAAPPVITAVTFNTFSNVGYPMLWAILGMATAIALNVVMAPKITPSVR